MRKVGISFSIVATCYLLSQVACAPWAMPEATGITLEVLATIELGSWPTCVAVNEATDLVYVGVRSNVLTIDGPTNSLVGNTSLGFDVEALAVDPQRNRLYASGFSETIAYDAATFEEEGSFPEGAYNNYELAVDPTRNRVYIADWTTTMGHPDRVRVYDGSRFEEVGSVEIPGSREHVYIERVGLAVNPETNRVYASWRGDKTLHLIDGESLNIIRTVSPDSFSLNMWVNPSTNRVYISDSVLDGETLEEIPSFFDGTLEAINPRLNLLYTVTGYDHLTLVEGETLETLTGLSLETSIDLVKVNSVTGKIYACRSYGTQLFVIQGPREPFRAVTFEVDSSLGGLVIDGVTYSYADLPVTFLWEDGSRHSVAVLVEGDTEDTRVRFLTWSDGPTEATRTVIVSASATYRAEFQTQFYLDVSSSYGNPQGSGWYDEGTKAQFGVSTPVDHGNGTRRLFLVWSEIGLPTPTGLIAMDGPRTLRAIWITQHYVTVEGGIGEVSGEGWYDEYQSASVAAVSEKVIVPGEERVVFTGWSGDLTSASPGVTVLVDSPKTLVANWMRQYHLLIDAGEGVVDASSQWVDDGTVLSVAAHSPCHVVEGESRLGFTVWSGAVSSDQPSVSVVMDRSRTLEASWVRQYYLRVDSQYGNPTGEGWYDEGVTAAFSVTTPIGFVPQQVFTGWTGDYSGTSSSGSIVVSAPSVVRASWRADYTYLYLIIGVLTAVVAVFGIVFWRRRRPAPPAPPTAPMPFMIEEPAPPEERPSAETRFRKGIGILDQGVQVASWGVQSTSGPALAAAEEFRQAEALDPDNADYRYYHAVALRWGLQFQSAIEQFKRVLEVEPNHFEATKTLEHNVVGETWMDRWRDPFYYVPWSSSASSIPEGLTPVLQVLGQAPAGIAARIVILRDQGRKVVSCITRAPLGSWARPLSDRIPMRIELVGSKTPHGSIVAFYLVVGDNPADPQKIEIILNPDPPAERYKDATVIGKNLLRQLFRQEYMYVVFVDENNRLVLNKTLTFDGRTRRRFDRVAELLGEVETRGEHLDETEMKQATQWFMNHFSLDNVRL